MLESLDHGDSDKSSDVLEIKGAAGQMYCAGAETVRRILNENAISVATVRNQTWTTLTVFFLAMVLHPECQKRAQEEIDSVIGSGRLPEFSDRESLPYMECILQETMRLVYNFIPPQKQSNHFLHRRWNPVVPLGMYLIWVQKVL